MSIITKKFNELVICRFDKDGIIPYFEYTDFPGLRCEEKSFTNCFGDIVRYFIYSYPKYREDKCILFCPGMGPGHTSYLREIEKLCSEGFLVYSLDYTGTGESEGESVRSLNQPTRDIIQLLEIINNDEKIVLIGHSWGGYSALNVINIRENIKEAIVISPFITIKLFIRQIVKLPFLGSGIIKQEKEATPEFKDLDNLSFLKRTKKDILYIHSIDDNMVKFKYSGRLIKHIGNKHIKKLFVNNKSHNPNYTVEAVKYMKETFSNYNQMIKEGLLLTPEDKIKYMSEKSIWKMTEQDQDIYDQIMEFIDRDVETK